MIRPDGETPAGDFPLAIDSETSPLPTISRFLWKAVFYCYPVFAVLLILIMKELSVVIPVMNEEDNIQPLLEAVRNALSQYDYEVVLVDDGSTDNTKKRIIENADEHVRLVELRKNYGQSTAMTAGIDYANARVAEGGYLMLNQFGNAKWLAC